MARLPVRYTQWRDFCPRFLDVAVTLILVSLFTAPYPYVWLGGSAAWLVWVGVRAARFWKWWRALPTFVTVDGATVWAEKAPQINATVVTWLLRDFAKQLLVVLERRQVMHTLDQRLRYERALYSLARDIRIDFVRAPLGGCGVQWSGNAVRVQLGSSWPSDLAHALGHLAHVRVGGTGDAKHDHTFWWEHIGDVVRRYKRRARRQKTAAACKKRG